MLTVARTDRTVLGRWWWTVDRWTLAAVALLMAVGVVLIVAGSPAVAIGHRLDTFHFVKRHLVVLPVAVAAMLIVSLATPRQVRQLALLMALGAFVLLLATLMIGNEIKGARRWISVAGFSIQPSEFAKPALAVLSAWLFARYRATEQLGWLLMAIALLVLLVLPIAFQPDIGSSVVMVAVWLGQLFIAGLSLWLVLGLGTVAIGGFVGAYHLFPHVQSRVDRFLDPSSGDTYQIDVATRAFHSGGLFGVGPGDGTLKYALPDAHADFVFAVAGEELGGLACLLIILTFAFVVARGVMRAASDRNLFVILAAGGLLAFVALQSAVNMASALHMIPTKGMTLPFISYGGSSLLAMSIVMGMVLALTRRRTGYEAEDEA